MPKFVTGTEIAQRAAVRMHLPEFAAGEFVTDGQALVMLKDACERLSAMLLRSFGGQYFALSATTTVQPGAGMASLPQDAATVEAVYWLNGDREILLGHDYHESGTANSQSWSESDPPRYRLEGAVMTFRPISTREVSVRVAYQSTPSIADLCESLRVEAGWAEWLVLDLCEQISDREDKDPSRWILRKEKIETDLKAQLSKRDRGARYQVVDAYGARADQRVRNDWRF